MQKRIDIPRDILLDDHLTQPGMSSCQGCGAALSMKLALRGLGKRTIVVFPACCYCVFVGSYPNYGLGVPVIHCPFGSAAAVASGVAAALERKGQEDVVVMVWAGDGGTFDIGLQSLSGAAERNENILFVCYDNEAYMNTGIQRSSATPPGAWTTTTPDGDLKSEPKKRIEQIMLAHGIAYLATASAAYPDDLFSKFRKVRGIKGTRFIHLLSACPPGWRIDAGQTVRVTRMATQANVFPIYEVERRPSGDRNGGADWHYTINIIPGQPMPVETYLRAQGRFKHMTDELAAAAQVRVNREWNDLLIKTGRQSP